MTDDPTKTAEPTIGSKTVENFPRAEVISALKDELLTNVEMQAAIYGTTLPTDQAKLLNQQVVIDSLVAVEILCVVDAFIGFELKAEGIVREGGYNSVKEAVEHMLPRIEKAWLKKHGQGRKI